MKSNKRSHFETTRHHSQRSEAAKVNEAQPAFTKKRQRLSHILCFSHSKEQKSLYDTFIVIKHLLWTACSVWAATWPVLKTHLWTRNFIKHLFTILKVRKCQQCGIFSILAWCNNTKKNSLKQQITSILFKFSSLAHTNFSNVTRFKRHSGNERQ